MKPTELAKALTVLTSAGQPTFVWGAPGIGKSSLVAQVAGNWDGDGIDLIDVRAPLYDAVDVRGFPMPNLSPDGDPGSDRMRFLRPDFLPPMDHGGAGILFLDELSSAPPLVQAAFYQLVLDRHIGEHHLPEGWAIIAAGNREGDAAVVSRMSSALANRFVHLELEVDLNDWCSWALGQADMPAELVAFIRWRPELLHQFDPRSREKAFPSPRSWAFAGRMIASGKLANGIEFPVLAGAVGEPAAAELVGFLRVFRQMPSPESILMDPQAAPVPEDPAVMYAICGALAKRATDTNFDRIVAYSRRMPGDFGVLMVRDSIAAEPAVQHTRAYIEWASANSGVLI